MSLQLPSFVKSQKQLGFLIIYTQFLYLTRLSYMEKTSLYVFLSKGDRNLSLENEEQLKTCMLWITLLF